VSRGLGKRARPTPAAGIGERTAAEKRAGDRYRRYVNEEAVRRLNWGLVGPRLDPDTGVWSQAHRSGSCGQALNDRVALGRAVTPDGEARGTIEGAESCGSGNLCLRCAGKIRAQRAQEVEAIIRAHLARGGTAYLVTFTLSHGLEDTVAQVIDDAMTAWTAMTKGRAWRNMPGKSGFIRSTEVTYGRRNGAHPHHHVVILLEPGHELVGDDWDGGTLEQFRARLDTAWGHQVDKLGRSVDPIAGVTVEPIRDAGGIGAYVSKIGLEVARSDLKTGRGKNRSHWEVALGAAKGSASDRALWAEFIDVMSRHKFMAYSNGLLARYELREVTDETAATDKLDSEPTAFLDATAHAAALRAGLVPELRGLLESDASPFVLAAVIGRRLGHETTLHVLRIDDGGVPTIGLGAALDGWRPPERLSDALRARAREWGRANRAALIAACAASSGVG
jgi:hypothetical protein